MNEHDTFLSVDEVCRLTGYKRHAEQREHLRHVGIKFVVSRLGEPLVLRKAFEAMMGAPTQGDEALIALDNYARNQDGQTA